MLTKNLQRHLLDPVLVIDQLAFVLGEEGISKLPDGCRTTSINESLDEQRLVDVTHAHLGFEEGYEVVKFHGLNLSRV